MFPQKLVTCQPVRRFPTYYHVYRNPLLGPLLSQTNPIHTLTSYFFQIYFNILSSMPMSSKWPLSAGFPTITLYAFLCFPIHATSPNPCILLHLVVLLILVFGQKYRSWSSSLCNFLHLPITCTLLCRNILLSILFSNTPALCSSHNMIDQVSHTYKKEKAKNLDC